MPRPSPEDLRDSLGTPSRVARAAVIAARERQAHRLAGTGLRTNAELPPGLVREVARADASAMAALHQAYKRGSLSARGHERILRVARTIADLDASARVRAVDVKEALSLRREDALDGAAAAA